MGKNGVIGSGDQKSDILPRPIYGKSQGEAEDDGAESVTWHTTYARGSFLHRRSELRGDDDDDGKTKSVGQSV